MTRILRYALLMTACALPSLAAAQTTPSSEANPSMMVTEFCKGGTVIIVDGVRECRIQDSLDALIADFEQMEISGNPISAGEEGDRKALRKLPNVSAEALAESQRITIEFAAV